MKLPCGMVLVVDERAPSTILVGIEPSSALEEAGLDTLYARYWQELGNYLRLVPETVSRLLARFHERGWLSVRRRNVIAHDLEQLRLAARGEHADAAPVKSTAEKRAGSWSREAGSECG